jgi:hypothetical protein
MRIPSRSKIADPQ